MTSFLCDEVLPTLLWIVHALKSGEASLFTDGLKTLQLSVKNKEISVNLMSKELFRVMLRGGVGEKGYYSLERLRNLKNIAEELKRDGFTVTISHKGYIVLTLGSGANPTLSQLVTGTNAIEINDLRKLIQLAI